MSKNDDIREIIESHKKYFITSLVSAAYLTVWIALQWCVNWTINHLPLEGIDKWVLHAFQILFSISTLSPIVINLISDIRIMIFRSNKRVDQERKQAPILDLQGELSIKDKKRKKEIEVGNRKEKE